ncbi:hypothetical protein ACS0TY_017624 [Phlomoides rotata]
MSTSSIIRELFGDDSDHDIDNNNPPENIEEFDHANVVVEDSDQEDDSNPPENNYGEKFDNNVVEDHLEDDEVPPDEDVMLETVVDNETNLVKLDYIPFSGLRK